MQVLLIILTFIVSTSAFAQDPPRFTPPRPMDSDFEDPVEEEIEPEMPKNMIPGVPPPQVGQVPPSPPTMNDFRPSGGGGANGMNNGKMHFKVVDGEYYEKGKPRGRAPINRR